ncbi:MAG: anthranilate synthase component I family protein [Actinobacteria bacterium]|nr:anthranilate synthase component I family protein [Actinomycetota bacterium]
MSPHLTTFLAPSLDPVALLRGLGLEGRSPVVLLDSAGGSPQLAHRHYLAWDPIFRLRVRGGAVSITADPGAEWAGEARRLAQQAHALEELEPFEAVRAATRLAELHEAWRQAERPDAAAIDPRPAPVPAPGSAADTNASDGPFPEAEALFGLLAYDAVRYLERLPDTTRDDLGLPDIDLFLPGRLLRYDLASCEALLLDRLSAEEARAHEAGARVGAALAGARRPSPAALHGNDLSVFRSNFRRPDYEAVVARTREYVYAGDIFQANLSQRLDGMYALPSLHLYQTLRTVNPSPFAGYLHFGDYELISSSPERLVSLDQHGWAETRPIAGTRPRGDRRPEDDALAEELNLDPKDRAEHIMLVDLERNDLGKVCEYGSVRVSELMVNEYYSHVIHIVSNVRGHLHPSRDAVDLAKAMFPGGTITGCPKVRCMEIVDELETVRRGPYTGSFGWIAGQTLDLNIVIRTLVRVGDRLFLQVGGGIVADSVPEREYRETLHKAAGMLRAVSAGIAERAG